MSGQNKLNQNVFINFNNSETQDESIINSKPKKNYCKKPKIPEHRNSFIKHIDWKKELNNPKCNIKKNINIVIQKAAKIEMEANIKEKILEAKGGIEVDPMMGEKVTEMFIESIKGKLAILDQT